MRGWKAPRHGVEKACGDYSGILDVTIYSTRFGPQDIAPEQRWVCAQPMPGFEAMREFALLRQTGQEPFIWLQSLEALELAFLIVDASCFGLRFQPPTDAEFSGFDAPPSVLVILPYKPGDVLRVHRLAPLLFDVAHARFVQHVYEPEQVSGEGLWAGSSGAWPDAAVQARIVQVPYLVKPAARVGSRKIGCESGSTFP
ncbi:MAG: flagellar assembly protein FliW [Burkholderiales bacterium]|jgi:hypothetical protein|nr:flagellar assembly protein FliW [Burkholderiales bacterium]